MRTNKGNGNLVSHASTWHPLLTEALHVAAVDGAASKQKLAEMVQDEIVRLNSKIQSRSIKTMLSVKTARDLERERATAGTLSIVQWNRVDLVLWSLHHGVSYNAVSCPLWTRMNERVGVNSKAISSSTSMSERDIPLVYNIVFHDLIKTFKDNKVGELRVSVLVDFCV